MVIIQKSELIPVSRILINSRILCINARMRHSLNESGMLNKVGFQSSYFTLSEDYFFR